MLFYFIFSRRITKSGAYSFLNTVHGHLYPDCDFFYPLTKTREAKVTLITPERIKIVRLREELVFEAGATGLYMSLDGKKVTVNDTGATRLFIDCCSFLKLKL